MRIRYGERKMLDDFLGYDKMEIEKMRALI